MLPLPPPIRQHQLSQARYLVCRAAGPSAVAVQRPGRLAVGELVVPVRAAGPGRVSRSTEESTKTSVKKTITDLFIDSLPILQIQKRDTRGQHLRSQTS